MADSHFSDKFRSWVTKLHQAVRAERFSEETIHSLYQDSEEVAKEYSAEPWPTAQAISGLVRDDKPFLLLYTEMAYQAFFKNKNLKPTMEHRIGSWENYSALFTYLINDEDGHNMREAAQAQGGDLSITGKWAFDIIYEFVYQFQDACQYRASVGSMPEPEQQLVLSRRDVWAVDKVYNLLHQLVRVSKVKEVLEAHKPESEGGPVVSYPSKLHYMLGYFALVGLNRLECLLGDFEGSLEAAEPVTRETVAGPGGNLLSNILIAQVSLYYHIGLSSFMVRKYQDAVRAFVTVLESFFKHLDALKQQRAAQQNQQNLQQKGGPEFDTGVAKLVEKVATMLLIVLHLCPGHHVPDSTRGLLNSDKHKDKARDIQSGDVEQIAKHFYQSAPKFISPATDFDDASFAAAPRAPSSGGGFQRTVFRKEVQQMLELRKLREYLKLYSTIGLDKLSSFTGASPDEIRRELIQFKHKLLQLDAIAAQGDGSAALDFHYFLEGDMVHIDEAEKESRHEVAKRFQRQIDRLEGLASALRR